MMAGRFFFRRDVLSIHRTMTTTGKECIPSPTWHCQRPSPERQVKRILSPFFLTRRCRRRSYELLPGVILLNSLWPVATHKVMWEGNSFHRFIDLLLCDPWAVKNTVMGCTMAGNGFILLILGETFVKENLLKSKSLQVESRSLNSSKPIAIPNYSKTKTIWAKRKLSPSTIDLLCAGALACWTPQWTFCLPSSAF